MGIQIIGADGDIIEDDTYKKSLRVTSVARAAAYSVTGITGTMAAALASNSTVFGARLDPAVGVGYKALIQRIRVQWTTIVAFTTPITAGRRLAIFRGSGAATAGGGALVAVKKDSDNGLSQFLAAEGGDIRIATTATLTVAGITYETDPIRTMTLSHVGAAGGFLERVWEFSPEETGGALVLNPGEIIAMRNPAAMDAAGTWQAAIDMDWIEGLDL